ncbi:MAG: hypothetical protein QF577_00300, partial [Phycisphaerae bacterium]|nr:hypothetical protein [Phycisphaerae bacterium]
GTYEFDVDHNGSQPFGQHTFGPGMLQRTKAGAGCQSQRNKPPIDNRPLQSATQWKSSAGERILTVEAASAKLHRLIVKDFHGFQSQWT